MVEQRAFIEAFQRRILLAALGTLPTLGCGSGSEAPRDALPAAHPSSTGDSSVVTSSSAGSASSGRSEPIQPQAADPDCFEPFTSMRAVGTGAPASKPAPSAFDKHGCLPFTEVSNGCCNGAMAGPHFKDGKCCYDIPAGPCCGRPYRIDGISRVADIALDRGWSKAISCAERPNQFDEPTRKAMVIGWLRDARMEHASVASFARFVTDLLAVGAPASMVREAAMALTDEIAHAESCFEIASRLAGTALGPGPLSAATSSEKRGLEEVVKSAVIEGCVGETVAVFMAHRRLELVRDNHARSILARIVEDEARHAELAFRFVRWAVSVHGDRVRPWIAEALEESYDTSTRSDLDNHVVVDDYHAMGLLSPALERKAIDEATHKIARRAVLALVESSPISTSLAIESI